MTIEKQNLIARRILIGIGIIILVLVVFKAGMFVGYKKASFSYGLGENYYRTFGGQRLDSKRGMINGFFRDNMMLGGHGVTGKVIRISLPSIVVEGPDNVEKVIITDDKTLVRTTNTESALSNIKVDDTIVVIGSPTDKGEVSARLIRILQPK